MSRSSFWYDNVGPTMAAARTGFAMLVAVAAAAPLTGCRRSLPPPSTNAATEAGSTENPDAGARSPEVSTYDLDADLRSRVGAAKGLWGPDTHVGTVANTFVIVAADRKVVLVQAVSLAARALDALFHDRFRLRPDRAVTVTLWSTAAGYDAYCNRRVGSACGDDLGVYIVRTSEILVNVAPGLTTLTHEIVHPIVQHDFPLAPKWLDEGLASLFEAPVFPSPGEIHGVPNWRMPSLAAALARSDERSRPRLEALFGMSDDTFLNGDRLLHYAMARALCEWLDERNELWPFYQAWRDAGSGDPDGLLAFQSVVHETPAQANGEWARWVVGRSRGYRR
jgi:hypothetical protein